MSMCTLISLIHKQGLLKYVDHNVRKLCLCIKTEGGLRIQKKEETDLSSGKSISETKKYQTIDRPNAYQFAVYQSFL